MSASALKAAATGQVQAPPKNIWHHLENKKFQAGMAAVASKFLDADRMLRLCINAVKKTPRLLECDPQSVLGAMMASTALGLEPNTVQQQAFLIPYKKRVKVGNNWVDAYDCQFQVGARGFVTLAYRSPYIKSLHANAIHERDLFEQMQGSESFLRYAVNLRARGDLIGAYSHVMFKDGGESACVLPLDELLKIRARSETYRSLVNAVQRAENDREAEKAREKLAETPWEMWIDDMVAKSAIKKHSKQLPLASGDAMAVAAELDNRSDMGTLDIGALADPEITRAVMADEADLPALENNASEALPVSGEAFGTAQRQAVPAQQEQPQASAAGRRTRAAAAPAGKPAPTANDFIERIDNAADAANAAEILAQAKASGLAPDQLQLVVEAHAMAWPAN